MEDPFLNLTCPIGIRVVFQKVKEICLENGALGSGISGSGPSIFALSRGEETAKKVAEGMADGA